MGGGSANAAAGGENAPHGTDGGGDAPGADGRQPPPIFARAEDASQPRLSAKGILRLPVWVPPLVELEGLRRDEEAARWYYIDPQARPRGRRAPPGSGSGGHEKLQGPHPLCQLQSWMSFLAASAVGNAEHQLAYARFSGVSVCKAGDCYRVPLILLLPPSPTPAPS
ncbi:hypothetical protein APUTEX25_002697 [Auxenochlorella protothecoides]|uniref:Uncharacterized protein n=1 Tax=Auxenochlorella protothecoides TaxID=3075 RepID=A0A3M7KWH7_AUXPR|nr:hypothetical protein APUTEX25_002697 [Auxenochlorella protothecoides]|eukprot:RMZ54120.1 hypothetical protein APUTEX25_002697 [Auxenochlorella protothecoides]